MGKKYKKRILKSSIFGIIMAIVFMASYVVASISLGSNFQLNSQLPLDARTVISDITGRDNIPAGQRYEGLTVYVISDSTNYQLQGGITNADWTNLGVSGGGGSTNPSGLNTEIQFNNNGSFGSSSDFTWTKGDAGVPASLGADVTFTKLDNELIDFLPDSTPVDYISPSVHLTRGVSLSMYNEVTEFAYNKTDNSSPEGTEWNSEGWGDLSDVAGRRYASFYAALNGAIGNNIIGSELVMHDIAADKYYKFSFSYWGSSGTNGGLSYTRNLINLSPYSLGESVIYTKSNSIYPTDFISPTVQITRGIDKGIYNPLEESVYDDNNYTSPLGTEWNSDGWGDFSNITERTYVNFYESLNQAVGENIIGSELIMHDIAADKYYKFSFSSWTQSANGGGFSYTRNLINPSTSSNNKLTTSANFLIGGLNRYLNFGSISGASGYGIRDNNGNIEYKDNGDIWSSFSNKFSAKQDVLVNGLNISTINGASLLNGGNISITAATPIITSVNNSNLFSTGLTGTGNGVTSTGDSIFLGRYAGYSAYDASYSNFLGYQAGYSAGSASSSNFFGYGAGYNGYGASYSNFIGGNAGSSASYAAYSNFLGYQAGYGAYHASNSIFIGNHVGYNDTVYNFDNVNNWSILLGYNSNTGGFSNSILLGGASSGMIISNTKTNQFMLAPSVINLRLRDVDYVLPNYQGAANTVLTNDGTGILTWTAGGTGGGSSQWITNGNDINYDLGNVGIGITTPAYKLHVFAPSQDSINQPVDVMAIEVGSPLSGTKTGYGPSILFKDLPGGDSYDVNNMARISAVYENSTYYPGKYIGALAFSTNQSAGILGSFPDEKMRISSNGNVGIGITNPTAFLNIKAGNSYPGNAPIKLTAGVNLSTSEAGAIEYDGNHLYFTATEGGARFQLDQQSGTGGSSPIEIVNGSNLFSLGLSGTGSGVTSVMNSNFLGINAGLYATNASNSNFFGTSAGAYSTNSVNSNFFGQQAGFNATYASSSNFFGYFAGSSANHAVNSNFFGTAAGSSAVYAYNSNFLGSSAGSSAVNASNSIFIGQQAGYQDTVDNTSNGLSSILLGSFTKTGGFSNSILLGSGIANFPISNTKANQFMLAPSVTEMQLSGIDYTLPSAQATSAGYVLTNNGSGILTWAAGGTGGGTSPIEVVNTSNLFSTGLTGTGSGATTVTHSVFLGIYSGGDAVGSNNSNFFGQQAGYLATNASMSNFFGQMAGQSASANNSNFFGQQAGYLATNASMSNFFGLSAGSGASNASNSIFLGVQAGYNDTVDNTSNGLSSVLLGSYTNTGGFSNSILLGSGVSDSPISNTKANQFMLAPSVTEIQLSGIDYTLPSSQASAYGDVLTNDGNGVLTWTAGGTGGGTSPIEVVNTSNLFSTGLAGAGSGVDSVSDSIFLGQNAGSFAYNASGSNFLGNSAGASSTDAYNSNFFGSYAGSSASNAYESNFLGSSAGQESSNASSSNFFGSSAGSFATNASNSIFIGQQAGYQDTVDNTSNGLSSVLIGSYTNTGGFSNSIVLGSGVSGSPISNTKANQFMLAPTVTEMRLRGINYTLPSAQATSAGYVLTNNGSGILTWAAGGTGGGTSPIEVVNTSNLFSTGLAGAGSGVTTATNSIFLGLDSGSGATDASNSNFLGSSAGQSALNAYESNFLGNFAGYAATNASNSNFWGTNSGNSATNAYESNFLGFSAGYEASLASYSNFFGTSAGYQAINASGSNFFGADSGYIATDAYDSNFIGSSSGYGATGAYNSNFLGNSAGHSSTGAYESNFLGSFAGAASINASDSNFFGYYSGQLATDAYDSNFFGYYSGKGASNASNSNFIGSSAGQSATNAYESNFLGSSAGNGAINASNSNFFGSLSGQSATNASNSNFFGLNAGYSAFNASNSIFIGQLAGSSDTVNNTTNVDDFSILIGKSTKTGGFKNSIALGGSAVNTAINQFMIGSVTRPINSTVWKGTGGTQCTITTGTGIACTSDERLKNNITDLSSDTLEKLIQVRTVSFNWKDGNTATNNIGFLAQDLEKFFPETVATDINGFKSVYYANMTPILTEAIRELDLKIMEINNVDIKNTFRDNMVAWFTNTANTITEFVAGTIRAKDQLCIGEGEEAVCVTKEELLEMKNNITTRSVSSFPMGPIIPAEPKKEILPINPIISTEPKDEALPVKPVTPVINPVVPAVEIPIVIPTPVVEEKIIIPEIKKEEVVQTPVVAPEPSPKPAVELSEVI